MMKRALAAVLAALVLSALLSGCGSKDTSAAIGAAVQDKYEENGELPVTRPAAPEADPEALNAAADKMMDSWFRLMAAYEEIYTATFCALDHSEAFTADNTWNSVLKARTSCSAARVMLKNLELPTLELSEQEITLLLDAGVEVNVVQVEFEALALEPLEKEDALSMLHNALENDVFLTSSVEEMLPEMIRLHREFYTMECRYMWQFTNYLMLQTGRTELWDSWLEQLPCMAACADVWYDRTEDVEAASSRLLDEMEILETGMGSILGVSEYTLEIVREAAETGDVTELSSEVNILYGIPEVFPTPYWFPEVTQLYLMRDAGTGDLNLAPAGVELTELPAACYINCGNISREDVQSYAQQVEQWGIETYSTWDEEEQSYQLLCMGETCTVMVEWTSERTLYYMTDPVGCMIPELYIYAMLAK